MKTLLDKVQVGNLTLRNRIMFPPMTTGYEVRGMISDKSIKFYKEIAQGGAALIIIGDVAPVKTLSPIPMLFEDSQIASFKKLTDAIHSEGALVGAQIFHPEYNPEEIFRLFMEKDMMKLRTKLHHDMEHYVNEVSIEDLKEIQNKIVDCAIRASKAGFDMIQIHGDRIVGALSSPILNLRTDEYGGSLENRTRFGMEIVQGIRKVLPEIAIDYKLAMIRTNPYVGKGGPTIEEGVWFAKELEKNGVDSIHACQANHSSVSVTIPAAATAPFMCFSDFSEAIKRNVNIPVSAVGRIVTPEHARTVLQNNQADIISLGRALLADPEWVNKIQNGTEKDIRSCIMCNKGCTDKIVGRSSVGCAINGNNGIDFIVPEIPDIKKNIMVIGAGPGGLEASRVLSTRGHNVTLYEQSNELGGQLNIAVVPEHKLEMNNIKNYLVTQVQKSETSIILNTTMTIEKINEIKPDHIILATGATPRKLDMLQGHSNLLSAWDILKGKEVGSNVVVIGGGSVGIEAAGYIYKPGRTITIIESTKELLRGESSTVKSFLLDDLAAKNIVVLTETQITQVNSNSVMIDGNEISCDTLVYAVGSLPNNSLVSELDNSIFPYSIIGDAKSPRLLENAIREAYETSVKL